MLPDSDWPLELQDFEAFLARTEVNLRVRQTGNGFGDGFIEYTASDLRVRIVSDRGQWFVDVSAAAPAEEAWYDPAIIRDYLMGHGDDVLTLQEQTDFIKHNWQEIRDKFSPSLQQRTLLALNVLRKDRASRRIGL
jgi:hypothetical protein